MQLYILSHFLQKFDNSTAIFLILITSVPWQKTSRIFFLFLTHTFESYPCFCTHDFFQYIIWKRLKLFFQTLTFACEFHGFSRSFCFKIKNHFYFPSGCELYSDWKDRNCRFAKRKNSCKTPLLAAIGIALILGNFFINFRKTCFIWFFYARGLKQTFTGQTARY